MLKVAIDSGSLSDGNAARGVGVYTKKLAEALKILASEENQFTTEVIDFKSRKEDLPKFDIVHYPYFDFFFNTLQINKYTKTVVTIHDTIPLIYPKYYPPGLKGKIRFQLQKKALKNVNHIITDSENSKKDIVRFLNIAPEKISVVYLGPPVSKSDITTKEIKESLQEYSLPEKYILYIGDVNWNKNLLMLCRASKRSNMPLVIVGKSAVNTSFNTKHIENKPLHDLISQFGNDSQVLRIGFVPDLDPIIKGATFLCQPSIYEGFGLSVLDAMTLGVPTLISKIQVFTELYEGASLFFDPKSETDLVSKINELKNNSKLRLDLIKKGISKSKEFSWNKTASSTFKVYSNALLY